MHPLIRNIGCICFGFADVADPLLTIRNALRVHEDLSDTLIVLPEALDLADKYHSDTAAPAFGIGDLKSLANEYKVALVVGLSNTSRPFKVSHNSALRERWRADA